MESAIVAGRRTVVVFRPEWHEGVVGIAAGRLKEKAWRPTFVFTRGEDGNLKGSGRSIPGFHLRDALVRVETLIPGILLKFGGHAMAAGATMRETDFEAFRECFEQVASGLLTEADLSRVVEHDGSLSPRFYSIEAADQLRFEVWGQMFPEPLFLDDFEVKSAKTMGKEANHLRLGLQRQGREYEAVKFFMDGEPPAVGTSIRAMYRLDVSQFAGRAPTMQLRIEHLLLD
jgi:single-stranded-DNA-specific exonuclease